MKSNRMPLIIGILFVIFCCISVFVGFLYFQTRPPGRLSDSGYYVRITKVYYYPGFGLSEPFEIENAHVSTFEILDELGQYAKDKNHVYFQGAIIPEADPQTFSVLNENYNCAVDANHAYQRDNTIPDFNPNIIPANATVTYCSPDEILFTP